MQLSSELPPCEIIVPSVTGQNLSISQSLTLATSLVSGLDLLGYLSGILLLIFFLVLSLFTEASYGIAGYFLLYYFVYRTGLFIFFKKARRHLISWFLRMIGQIEQTARSELKVTLTSQTLQLDANPKREPMNIQQTYFWKQITSVTVEENDYRILLPDLPVLILPAEILPREWQLAFAGIVEEVTHS